MKKNLSLLVFLLVGAGLAAQPKLNFSNTRHDYGTIGKRQASRKLYSISPTAVILYWL